MSLADRCEELEQQIAAQAAQIEMLRDGLKRADDLLRTSYDHVSPLIREALAIQPDDQALEQFAAKVREQCLQKVVAQKFSEPYTKSDKDWNAGVGAALIAIRNIKELPK